MTTDHSGLAHPDYFVLASGSPRRRQFLTVLGIPFTVLAPGQTEGIPEIDETPLPTETPGQMVQRLSLAKAQAVAGRLPAVFPEAQEYPNLLVVAADTAVVVGREILGKPATPAEAVSMLTRLRQQPHYVLSGLTVIHPVNQSHVTRLHQSKVLMRPYTNDEVKAYVASGSPLDKAGAYGIQDKRFDPVTFLEGCYASVMGFPLGELAAALLDLGFLLPDNVARCCRQLIHTTCCQEYPNEHL